jgi:sugar phosphate isomerase/epimerase
MKLAVSTLHLLYKPLEEVFNELVALPVNRIEVADSGNHSLNTRRIERLQELASSYNIQYSIHAP